MKGIFQEGSASDEAAVSNEEKEYLINYNNWDIGIWEGKLLGNQ